MFIPKTCEPGSNLRVLTVSGLPEQIDMAKNEIEEIVNMVGKYYFCYHHSGAASFEISLFKFILIFHLRAKRTSPSKPHSSTHNNRLATRSSTP